MESKTNKDPITGFYTNLLEAAEKTKNGYKVDVEKMFEGLEKSGKHVTKIGVGHIISGRKLTEEEIAEYKRQDDERTAAGAKVVGDYINKINKKIMESMEKDGMLNKYRCKNRTKHGKF